MGFGSAGLRAAVIGTANRYSAFFGSEATGKSTTVDEMTSAEADPRVGCLWSRNRNRI
jgi:hypothetical protein